MPLVRGPYLGKPEMNRTGYAIELNHFLTLNVGPMRSQFSGKRRFNQRDPLSRSLRFIPRDRPATVCALYDFAATLAAFASAARFSLLRQVSIAILRSMPCA